jgi:uncharacterized membrane protein YeaQ/YmgE (transglycosylase-associated protein family)
MGILAWIIFGLIAGAIAQLIMPGNDPGGGGFMGWIITMVIGIVGAIIGGFVGAALGFGGVDGFNLGSFLIAVLGALIVLAIWRAVAGRSGGGQGTLAHR